MSNTCIKDWVISNLNKYKYTGAVKQRYDVFLRETGANYSFPSFRKEISRVYRKYNRGDWVKSDSINDNVDYDPTFEEKSEFVEEDSNSAHVYSFSQSIRTVDDLVKACGIDLSVWDIVSQSIKKQDLGVKDKEGSLQWEEGKMTGYVKYGRYPVVESLFHIHINLQRKVLVNPKFEIPKPVVIEHLPARVNIKPERQLDGMKSALILSDAQMAYKRHPVTGRLTPIHDRRALLLAMDVADMIKPDKIIYNGDFFDLPDWSDKFVSSPDMYFTLQPALLEFAHFHSVLRSISSKSEFHYIPGNHCQRLENAMMKNIASAHGLYRVDSNSDTPVLSLKNLLAHDTNQIEFAEKYPDGHLWLNEKLRIGHGDRVKSKSGATVSDVVNTATYSQVFGHIHRVEVATKTIRERDYVIPIHAASFGTMSSIDDGVVPSNKSRHNWQCGFGVEYYDENNLSYPVPIVVVDGKTIFNGRTLQVDDRMIRNYVDSLCEATGTDVYKE